MDSWIYVAVAWLAAGIVGFLVFNRFVATEPLSSHIESRAELAFAVVVIVPLFPLFAVFPFVQWIGQTTGFTDRFFPTPEPRRAPLPSWDCVNDRIGTWNGANFIAPDGSLLWTTGTTCNAS